MSNRFLFVALFATLTLALGGCAEAGSDPAQDDLARIRNADAEPGNWFTVGRDFGETRHSPLEAIDRDNVRFSQASRSIPVTIDSTMHSSVWL